MFAAAARKLIPLDQFVTSMCLHLHCGPGNGWWGNLLLLPGKLAGILRALKIGMINLLQPRVGSPQKYKRPTSHQTRC